MRSRGAAVLLVTLGVTGLAACGGAPEPQAAAISADDVRELEERVAALEERVAELEGAPPNPPATPSPTVPAPQMGDDRDAAFLADPGSSLGQDVTVTATITGAATVTDIGAVLRLGSVTGNSVPVVSATPTDDVGDGDVVEVSGTVVRVQRGTFEQDFGIAADELFETPARWFAQHEGDVAISADEITPVRPEPDR